MLHIPLWKVCFKIRGAKQDPIPNMTKLELTYVSVKCGIVDPDKNSLFTLVTNNDNQLKCKEFIRKVSDLKFNKVRQRQINKLNILVSRSKNNSQEIRQGKPTFNNK